MVLPFRVSHTRFLARTGAGTTPPLGLGLVLFGLGWLCRLAVVRSRRSAVAAVATTGTGQKRADGTRDDN
jgi:hypothetical protein